MLTELRISNFAIIDNLELEFSSGLVTFTGETGAGKSIILDAIEALVGARTDTSSIRAEADRAQLEAVFHLEGTNRDAVIRLLEAEDLSDDPDYVVLARELRREGRTVARINGHTVNVKLLKDIGSLLVDIHGQSEHLSLLDVHSHLNLVDRYADNLAQLADYRDLYNNLQTVRRELRELHRREQDATRRTELLTFQAEEIETAKPVPGEEVELKEERNRLANAENLAELGRTILALLDESEPEMPTISDMTGQLSHALTSLAKIDPAKNNLAEMGENLAVLVSELTMDVRAYIEEIEYNPRRLEIIEQRLELLRNLEKKYGGTLEKVLEYAKNARQELDQIANASELIEELSGKESVLLKELAERAFLLSERRNQAAKNLSAAVEKELADLNMPEAHFDVSFSTRMDENGVQLPDGQQLHFDENGIDQIEFLIAPNPGEGLKPMVKIASGGENSRLMLALKKVLAQADEIPTLIFDEIDQGIGGRVGFVVGEKLWLLAREHQVLCVTHLPQLAAFGDQHYRVEKQIRDGRTQTRVELLESENRLNELAQMLGAVSDTHLMTAEETLHTAQERTRVYLYKKP
jgi:DNA repair protein RecN (Recombination protein N)